MIVLLALHLVAGGICVGTGDRLGRRVYWLAGAPVAATLAWLLLQLPGVVDGDVVHQEATWVEQLGLTASFRLDGFAALMLLLVSGVGVAVFAYAAGYHRDPAEGTGRQAGLLAIFAGAMTGLVLADDLLVLVTCWELTSITSYLLIGNQHRQARARAAALHALMITGAGGMCLLAGSVLLGQRAGTFRISELLADPPTAGIGIALVLIVLGIVTKSAQYPFHGWLPGAMIAPTPISAYLHSATMVKAGVYLAARMAPAFATVGWWRPGLATIGTVTMVAGGLRAIRQHDLKVLLAFGTVSQLGFLIVLAGVGTPEATTAACVLLLAHGLFKAALFFAVGLLDRCAGTRDRRELPPLGRGWWPVVVVAVVSAASMAGVPFAFGFIAKEEAYGAFADGPFALSGVLLAALVAGSVLTAAYSWRFAQPIVQAARAGRSAADDDGERPAAPTPAFAGPALVLGALTLALGLVPSLADGIVGAAASSLDHHVHGAHLAIWHGIELPLVLSGLTFLLAAGATLVARAVEPRFEGRTLGPTSVDVYRVLLRGLNRGADRVTGVVQSGSLPVYAGTILLTAALLPTVALLGGDDLEWPALVDTPAHLVLAIVLLGSALAAATIRRRLSAALLLGVTGYAMAGLFVVQGAPDLALTQVTIETLSTVLFVLVLRQLPVRFERRSTARTKALRIAVSTAVAVGVFTFAVQVGTARDGTPVADEMVERALPDGDGRNIVNVILVDIRGLDTLGEITVLATAAIGMVALARAGRRPRHLQSAADAAGAGEGS